MERLLERGSMMKRPLLLRLALLLVLTAVPFSVGAQENDARLSVALLPGIATVQPGQEYAVAVAVNSGARRPEPISVVIIIDPRQTILSATVSGGPNCEWGWDEWHRQYSVRCGGEAYTAHPLLLIYRVQLRPHPAVSNPVLLHTAVARVATRQDALRVWRIDEASVRVEPFRVYLPLVMEMIKSVSRAPEAGD